MFLSCGLLLPLPCHADHGLAPELAGYDPAGQVRFSTPTEANAKRQELVDFIWSDGLPTTALPNVTSSIPFPRTLRRVTSSLVSNVDQLNFNINVDNYQLPSISYLLSPATPAATPRLGIVYQGHQGDLVDGISFAVNTLLEEGIYVAVTQMPLVGWNSTTERRTLTLPDGSQTTFGSGTGGHNSMFSQFSGTLNGGMFAYFLEPVVQTINLFVDQNPNVQDITMIGLSGGAWATHMAAAIDTRIDLSIPVAGALPLYARPFSDGSAGDSEQFYDPLYREIDAVPDPNNIPDTADGVASWLEIFALGGYGKGRRQIQVLNHFDSCCFSGEAYQSYDSFVSDRVDTLGQGDWDLVIDDTHRRHKISLFTIDNVIAPAIEIPEPSTCVMAALGLLSFAVSRKRSARA
ncbi:MAG: PEP-CTERM sorting domain-containing protein [Planctomycetes bacterium]|nr:PEP-CTERM sorting domain-containing protein [Planctomycetota bacterium]